MHDTAFRIGTLAMNLYADLQTAKILEIGAQNVNGSLRDSVASTTTYIGIDIEEGEGVDIIAQPGAEWPIEDDHFDLVMATSVFEHDTAFWKTFLQMCRKAKAGGHIYISAPSNGKVHRYPHDYWRFYPDAGRALEELARNEGFDLKLVESFVAEREGDEWNDFCAIFRRGPCEKPLPTNFVWQRVACTNALTWQSSEVFNEREITEDQILLRVQRENLEHVQRLNEAERSAWAVERESIARSAAEARLEFEKAKLLLDEAHAKADAIVRARSEADVRAAALEAEVRSRDHRIADLESNLRQREEESSQAWAQVEAERAARDDLASELQLHKDEVEELGIKLREADEWVFKLAGERRQAEQLSDKYELELRHEREARAFEQAQAKAASEQLQQLKKARRRHEDRIEENHRKIATIIEQLRESEVELATAKSEADSISAQLSVADEQLERTQRELSLLNRTARENERIANQMDRQLQWLRLVNEVLNKNPRGWRNLIPSGWRRQRQLRMLRNRGLFDSAAYLKRYPDVAVKGLDPLYHYIAHGMAEGREADINLD